MYKKSSESTQNKLLEDMWVPPPDFEADPPSKELAGIGTENIVEDFPFKSPIKLNTRDLLIQRTLNEKRINICKLTYMQHSLEDFHFS